MGPDGMSSWAQAYDTKDFEVVLHQVRNPLPVIASCTTFLESTWDIALSREPRIAKTDSLILRGMKYWLYWNRHAESVAKMTYRVEAIPLDRIMRLLGRPYDGAFPDVPKDKNTRRGRLAYPEVTVDVLRATDSLLAEKILAQARRYGYAY